MGKCSRVEQWDKKYTEVMKKWRNGEISIQDGSIELATLGVTLQKAKTILLRTQENQDG